MNNQIRERLESAKADDILFALRDNIMITPTQADRAAQEIEELRREAERLRKQLRDNAKYDVSPPYKAHRKWGERVPRDADIIQQLQTYAQDIWDNGDAHNLISRAIVEITYLRQRLDRLDLPY